MDGYEFQVINTHKGCFLPDQKVVCNLTPKYENFINKLFKPERVSLREHPEITEKLIQDKIAEDPSILGIGDLVLKDKERMQPKAGRLDLLFQDSESGRRYEVEIQLGKTDESHIVRTLEYWDIERKRYPQYDHCAVIIAEDITSRFLNVINLFNGFIPIIAIQVSAFKFDDDIGLVFTKVMDELLLGLVDDDEVEVQQISTNRDYWLKRGSTDTMQLTDKFIDVVNELGYNLQLSYTKVNVRLNKNGQIIPFVIIKPRKRNHIVLTFKTQKSDELDKIIDDNDFDDMGYMTRGSRYRLRIDSEDLTTRKEALKELYLAAEKSFAE